MAPLHFPARSCFSLLSPLLPSLWNPSSILSWIIPVWHGFGMQQLSVWQGQDSGMIQVLRLPKPCPASVPLLPPCHCLSSAGAVLPEASPSCRRDVTSPECVPPFCDPVGSCFSLSGTGNCGGTILFSLFSFQGLIPLSVPDPGGVSRSSTSTICQDLAL